MSETVLPLAAFTLEGEDYPLGCVFQIWEKREEKRSPFSRYEPLGFKFVNKNDEPDLFFRRVGGTAGAVGSAWQDKSETSHYFLKLDDSGNISKLEKIIKSLAHSTRNDSIGPRSISRNELLRELAEADNSFAREIE